MTTSPRHVEAELGAYSLGALEPREAARVEIHLRGCASCRRSLDGYRAITEGFLHLPRPLQPPARIRSSLKARLGPDSSPRRTLHRPAWRPQRYSLLTGALAVAVAVLSAVTWQMATSLRDLRDQAAAAQEGIERRARVDGVSLALLTYPGKEVAMVSGDHAYGTVLFEPRLPMAVLNAWGLPELAPGQTFQTWLIREDGGRVSAGVFDRDPSAAFTRVLLDVTEPVAHFVGLGVTIEPAGGSAAPTGPRVLAADF